MKFVDYVVLSVIIRIWETEQPSVRKIQDEYNKLAENELRQKIQPYKSHRQIHNAIERLRKQKLLDGLTPDIERSKQFEREAIGKHGANLADWPDFI